MHDDPASIYCDNFRGFHDTLLTFAKINFFVGENSTGKTSILSLMSLLETVEFWYQGNFNVDPVNLGNFSELTTSASQPITIGYTRHESYPREHREFIRIRFKNADNLPTLQELRIRNDTAELMCVVDNNVLSYRIVPTSEDPKTSNFSTWVRDREIPEMERIDLPKQPTINAAMLPQMLNHLLEKAGKKLAPNIAYSFLAGFYSTNRMVWIAPIRAKPKRTYDSYNSTRSPEGDHIPYIINQIVSPRKSHAAVDKIKEFGKLSGLFNEIATKRYGTGKTAPFEISVRMGRHKHKISNVGYGVSQVLPVLVETLLATQNGTWFLVQQPEVHLHPRAQAALGDLFHQLSTTTDNRFIIETHSDFLIDRYRLLVSQAAAPQSSAQVVFFEHYPKGNRIETMAIDKNGRYPTTQPKAFREFFLDEQLRLLTI